MSKPALLRSQIRDLNALAANDLAFVWRGLEQPGHAEIALRDVLPQLIDIYGSAAASVAADYYDSVREARAIRGGFRAIPAAIADSGSQSLVGWAIGKARDVDSFQTLLLGGLQRRIANFSRETVRTSSIQDPQAQGWVRVGTGECEWCDQYLDGEIHYVEGYDFDAHDWCQCEAEPAF